MAKDPISLDGSLNLPRKTLFSHSSLSENRLQGSMTVYLHLTVVRTNLVWVSIELRDDANQSKAAFKYICQLQMATKKRKPLVISVRDFLTI